MRGFAGKRTMQTPVPVTKGRAGRRGSASLASAHNYRAKGLSPRLQRRLTEAPKACCGSGIDLAPQSKRLGSGFGVSTSKAVPTSATARDVAPRGSLPRAGRGGRGRTVLCRTESQARSSQDSYDEGVSEDGGRDDVLLKDLLAHATQSRQRLHKLAAGSLSTITQGKANLDGKKKSNGASTAYATLDPLDFTHDNDYNTINVEHGKQVLSGSLVYEVLTMDWKGSTFRAYLKRRDLLRHYDLQPRDLRRIDPALADPSPCLSVRDNAILISLGGMRGIISANKAIVFEPDSPYTKKFVEIVSPRLAASSGTTNLDDASPPPGESEDSGPGDSSAQQGTTESLTAKYRQLEDKNLPFELECCEGSLMVLVGQLDIELDRIELRIGKLLEKLPAQVNTENLEELRKVKSILVELESKSEQVTELLADFLEDEDDIAGMNLTSQLLKEEEEKTNKKKKSKKKPSRGRTQAADKAPAGWDYQPSAGDQSPMKGQLVTVSIDESMVTNILEEAEEEIEEVEDLIEYYLQRTTSIFSETQTLLVGMRDMEESISVVLSSRRFEVNRLELALSMGSFAASIGAMLSGILGMNLKNKFEASVMAFYGVTVGIILICCSVFWWLFRYTRMKKIL